MVLIGSGNVAWHLASALHAAGIEILQVYSRRITSARKLAKLVGAKATNQLSKINHEADLYLFAITDTAIAEVAAKLATQVVLKNSAIFAHTSGATPMAVFKGVVKRYGIFYPLQTFSKNREVDITTVPFCINGNYEVVRKDLFSLAKQLSPTVAHLSDAQRAQLHVAAIFANNFTNHLFSISQQILAAHDLPFDLLRPLILETAYKVQDQFPDAMQTGPARRGDQATMDRHLALLEGHAEYQDLYELLSSFIAIQK